MWFRNQVLWCLLFWGSTSNAKQLGGLSGMNAYQSLRECKRQHDALVHSSSIFTSERLSSVSFLYSLRPDFKSLSWKVLVLTRCSSGLFSRLMPYKRPGQFKKTFHHLCFCWSLMQFLKAPKINSHRQDKPTCGQTSLGSSVSSCCVSGGSLALASIWVVCSSQFS